MLLFRVDLSVATSATRPPLWHEQSGWCTVYLFGNDAEDAAHRAKTIVETLPLVLTDTQMLVHDLDGPRRLHAVDADESDSELDAIKQEMEVNARRTGLALAFLPVGYAQRPKVADTRLVKFVIDPTHPGAK